jgi:hypothetical protein
MTQAISFWTFTADAAVRSQVNLCEICGEHCGIGSGFLRLQGFPLSVSFHVHLHLLLPEAQTSEAWGNCGFAAENSTVGYARTNVIGSRTSFVITSVRSSVH